MANDEERSLGESAPRSLESVVPINAETEKITFT